MIKLHRWKKGEKIKQDLHINTQPHIFEAWIYCYIESLSSECNRLSTWPYPDSSNPYAVTIPGFKLPFQKKIYLWWKINSPINKEITEFGVIFYSIYVDFYTGSEKEPSKVIFQEKVPVIKVMLRETNTGINITVELLLSNFAINYQLFLISITDEYPELKRLLYGEPLSPVSDDNKILFDYLIELEPENFINFCTMEVGRIFPTEFFVESEDKAFKRKYNIGSRIYYPDSDDNKWEFCFYGYETYYEGVGPKEELSDAANSKLMTFAQILIIPVFEKKFRVIFNSFFLIDEMIEWSNILERRILSVFPTIGNNLSDGLKKHEKIEVYQTEETEGAFFQDTKNLFDAWELIPEKGYDRTIIKLFCEGRTNTEISDILNLAAKTITNRISELRQKYPVPTREELRRATISKTHGTG